MLTCRLSNVMTLLMICFARVIVEAICTNSASNIRTTLGLASCRGVCDIVSLICKMKLNLLEGVLCPSWSVPWIAGQPSSPGSANIRGRIWEFGPHLGHDQFPWSIPPLTAVHRTSDPSDPCRFVETPTPKCWKQSLDAAEKDVPRRNQLDGTPSSGCQAVHQGTDKKLWRQWRLVESASLS